jgi:DeoR family fructose operon transcriptional repressor
MLFGSGQLCQSNEQTAMVKREVGHDAVAAGAFRYGAASARRAEILRRVREAGYVSAVAVSGELAVSEMTVRRDIKRLAAEALVQPVHGGARLPDGALPGSPFADRRLANAEAKRAIAAAAAGLVEPGTTVALDSGTTVLELALRIPRGAGLTVVTHSLAAMGAVAGRDDVTLIGLGGLYQEPTRSFGGPDTAAAIGRLRADTLFLAASAVDAAGLYCGNPVEAESKRALAAIARRVVLLADSAKTRVTAPVFVCGYDAVDVVVTDAGIAPDDERALRRAVRTVHVATVGGRDAAR